MNLIYTDARGEIFQIEDGVQFITSQPESKRANHWHREGGHNCILTKGSLDYYERTECQALTKKTLTAPVSFHTGPLVHHLMKFLEYSEMVCLRTGPVKDKETYEQDLVRLDYDLEELYNSNNGQK